MTKETVKELSDVRSELGITQHTIAVVLNTSINNIAALDTGRVAGGQLYDLYTGLLKEFALSHDKAEQVEDLQEITKRNAKKKKAKRRVTKKQDEKQEEIIEELKGLAKK